MSPFENVYSSAGDLYAYKHRTRRRVIAFIKLVIAFFVVYEIVSVMIVSTYEIRSSSMRPMLYPGDRVIGLPVLYGSRIPFTHARLPAVSRPRRGDVVAIRPPYDEPEHWWVRIADPFVRFFTLQRQSLTRSSFEGAAIERVVALPGDRVRMADFVVFVEPAGTSSFERVQAVSRYDYDIIHESLPRGWPPIFPLSGSLPELLLGAHEYFVMGDNRSASSDSASWGPVREADIVAPIVFRYWPLAVIASL